MSSSDDDDPCGLLPKRRRTADADDDDAFGIAASRKSNHHTQQSIAVDAAIVRYNATYAATRGTASAVGTPTTAARPVSKAPSMTRPRPLVPLPDATVASSDSAAARDCQWLRDLRLTREMLSPDKLPYVPAPRPATHHENRFPLTRLPVDAGAHYPQALFEDQQALTNVDHFVDSRGVCFPPSRFAWQPVFDQVHVNVRRLVADLPSCGALHGKKIGMTACPSKRFHRKESWSYWCEGWDMMTVVFAGPP